MTTSGDGLGLRIDPSDPRIVDPVVLALVNGESDDVVRRLKQQTRALALETAAAIGGDHTGRESLTDAFAGLHVRYPAIAGRDLPVYVLTLVRARALTAAAARAALRRVWIQTEFPQEALGLEAWVALWRHAGFTSDESLPRPAGALSLYRGAGTAAHVEGMSWTSSAETARWFAARFSPTHGSGLVVRALIEPDRVLARFSGRGEAEYVIDPRGITVSRIA